MALVIVAQFAFLIRRAERVLAKTIYLWKRMEELALTVSALCLIYSFIFYEEDVDLSYEVLWFRRVVVVNGKFVQMFKFELTVLKNTQRAMLCLFSKIKDETCENEAILVAIFNLDMQFCGKWAMEAFVCYGLWF